ncbi:hypothetical protein QTO34_014484 [Cnephaeus nilssonii]|uniref:Uncharacterized protein n=1 Tax=Cnephaeus nilssonii TaxID=3371016 RepID=A0AA40I6F3_CNENI|nr:hypothetical protein QTO34_014484 [Eptesicus nilssonii]
MPGLAAASPAPSETQEKKPLKPCCACPETKKARDACPTWCSHLPRLLSMCEQRLPALIAPQGFSTSLYS